MEEPAIRDMVVEDDMSSGGSDDEYFEVEQILDWRKKGRGY